MRHAATSRRASVRRWAGGAVAAVWLAFCAVAHAEHPIGVVDYSPGSRLAFDIGGGSLYEPLESTNLHYLLSADLEVIPHLHVRAGIPFSGYTGAYGTDSFIRGNIKVGASYGIPLRPDLTLGFALDLYTPTYQRSGLLNLNQSLPQDPRRAAMLPWHREFGYALADRFPMQATGSLLYTRAHAYAQLELGGTYAPRVRQPSGFHEPLQMGLMQASAAVGYNLFDIAEIGASVTSLIDPTSDAANMRDYLGLGVKSPRHVTLLSLGPRLQYEWAVWAMTVAFPLESRLARMMGVVYNGSFQAQF